jgi:KUP system potassium uptake protein
LQTVFSIDHGAVRATAGDVYGVISLVFWSITAVVSVKYVTFILRADNGGEGGVMALAALVRRALGNTSGRRAAIVMAVGVCGASLFYGDSVITPAISVLSAVEGLKVAAPGLSHLVVPLAAVILAVLFGAQRWGTTRIGNMFGPVMLVWFLTLAVAGLGRSCRILASCALCRRATRARSSPSTPTRLSSRWGPSCSRSPARRRCMRTWDTSGPGRSGRRGSPSSFLR